jgi:ribosomal protein S18 acetylase RimI-like enzyme
MDATRVTRTYLRLDHPDALVAAAPPPWGAILAPVHPCPVPRWRALYATIGGPWAWHDRDAWTDAQLAAHLADPAVRVFTIALPHAPADTPADAGFLELHAQADGGVEIAYLGVHPALLGRALGGWLVEAAVTTAFAQGARHVWLHTCTLDAPAALPNYLRRGFRVERSEEYDAPPRP